MVMTHGLLLNLPLSCYAETKGNLFALCIPKDLEANERDVLRRGTPVSYRNQLKSIRIDYSKS